MPAQAVRLRDDFDSGKLRLLADTSASREMRARLHALAQIYEGHPRGYVAQASGVTLQTLRMWVVRFNAGGPDALRNNFNLDAACRNGERSNSLM